MAAGKKTAAKAPVQKLSRGGEIFDIEKSATMFVAKRAKPDTSSGLAMGDPESFAQLSVTRCPGPLQLELCRISEGSMDDMMKTLRQDQSRIAWVGHVYHMPNDADGLMIPSDAIYVELKDNASEAEVNALLDQHGLELVPDPDSAANAYIFRLTSASTQNPLKIANALLESDAIEVAEPDLVAIASPAHHPSDTLFAQQWHLENNGGFGLTAGADVRAPQAWDISRGDRNIIVAVIDDGFDTSHPDFSAPGKLVAPADFGQDDLDPNPVSSRDNHGTACAGVAVADENGAGVVGLAPSCKLMPIRWSGSVSDRDIREQFNHASNNGADVISCSWGVGANFYTLSTSMKRSIQNAATAGRDGKGCVIIFAAGNANHDIDDIAGGTRDGFAIHPDVIAVAASNSRDQKSHYSNFGDAIWVCAPSSGQGGLGIVTTDRRGNSGYQAGDYTTVQRFGGTSSATPLVAGLCGLILSVNPDLSAEEVKQILKITAHQIDTSNGDYDANGHSRIFGYGRVDAHAALLEARSRLAPEPSASLVQFDRQTNLDIPDNNPGGVSDSILVTEMSTVLSLKVDVVISHSYRGDLKLQLIGPDDTSVTLFGRTHPMRDSRDNLITSFTQEDVPALSNLVGKNAQGNWTLRVSDLAQIDTGELESWSLTLGLVSRQTEWSVSPGLHLPDADPTGVTSEIEVDAVGSLRNIQVDVDITHTYRGDLKITLSAPSGLAIDLHAVNRSESEANLRIAYTPADTPGLQALIDQNTLVQGVWKLAVSDNLSQDIGKLNSWGIRLTT